MTLNLWKNFTKKAKSTAQPSGQPDYSLTVYLKEDTTLDAPVFLCDSVDLACNYAAFQSRYYFVRDIRMGITGQYELICETDYLATHKSAIGNSTFFVERSSHTYEVNISDPAVSQKQTYEILSQYADPFGSVSFYSSSGSYLIRVVGRQPTGSPAGMGIVTYLVKASELFSILDFLFDAGNFTDVISDAVVKAFFNPFQYIVDVRWAPFNVNDYISAYHPTTQHVVLGWWDTQVTAVVIERPAETFQCNLPAFSRRFNDFRDLNANWTRFKLYVPFVGNIEIDPVDYYAGDLSAVYGIDVAAGKGVFLIQHTGQTDYGVIFQSTFDFGVSVQIGQMATDILKIGSEAGASIGNAFVGNMAGAAVGGVNAIMNTIQPTPSIRGQTSSRILYPLHEIEIIRYSADSGEIPLSYSGRPLCKHKKISDIPGFIKCADADISIAGLAGDRENVNQFLNGGFFYE